MAAGEQQSSQQVALRAGDSVPDVHGVTLDGRCLTYRDIWQNRLLVLVTLPDLDSPAARRYLEELRKEARELTAHETEVLVRSKPAQAPAVAVADRWGEVRYVSNAERADQLPPASELVDWLQFIQSECPECQGEAR